DVAALLRLADWAQERLATQGRTPCPSPANAVCPPAVSTGGGAAAPRGAVAPADDTCAEGGPFPRRPWARAPEDRHPGWGPPCGAAGGLPRLGAPGRG